MAHPNPIRWVPCGVVPPAAGDLVSREAGGMPLYRIVSVDDSQAWVRQEGRETLERRPLAQLPWKAVPDA